MGDPVPSGSNEKAGHPIWKKENEFRKPGLNNLINNGKSQKRLLIQT